jgi:hypothetical protein
MADTFGGWENFIGLFWSSVQGSANEMDYLASSFDRLGKEMPEWEMSLASGVVVVDKLAELTKTATEEEFNQIYD